MNDYSIAFITCVNDEELYEECVRYIDKLNVPEGFNIRKIAIRNAKSMASGYNEAMENNNCKYKVYLHQDTLIINRNFIIDFVNEFNDDSSIGMLGVIGTEKLLTDGVWWHGSMRFGKVYQTGGGLMMLDNHDWCEMTSRQVQAIDGLIMITQYDIRWKEDIFDGWHFYDISQCIEFYKAGYKVCIPKQKTTWCIHACSIPNLDEKYEKYKNKFLENYSKDIFPLVSIMMTAYNRPGYFKIALDSAVNQTYKNIEIVICDNSTNDECEKVVKPYLQKHYNIRYYKNEKELEVIENFNKCLELSHGEYVSYLMDDDIYNIEKIAKMVNYFLKYADISLVTSYRQVIDEKGNFLNDITATRKIFEKDTIVDGKIIVDYMMENLVNAIGETTTPLFRKKDIESRFGFFKGTQYKTNADMVTWIKLCYGKKMCYISEALSYFRIHDKQDQRILKTMLNGLLELFNLAQEYNKSNGYNSQKSYHNALRKWKSVVRNNQNCDKNNSSISKYEEELLESLNSKYEEVKYIIFKNKRKVMFSCITTYHVFVAYILSKTIYKDDYKIILLANGHHDYQKIYNNMDDLNLWEEIIVIDEKYSNVKNQLKNIDFDGIDILHYFSWGSIANSILLEFVSIDTVVYLTDDGVMTYMIKETAEQWMKDNKLSNMPIDLKKITEIWVFDKRLFISDIDITKRDIEFKKYIDTDLKYILCEELNHIFGYKHENKKFDIIFFDQYLTLSGITNVDQERYLLTNIADVTNNLNCIIKKHPTDNINKYNGTEINNILTDMIPWEVIYLNYYINNETNNQTFMTYTSTAMLTNIFLFKNSLKNNKFIFLYNILCNLTGGNEGYESFNIFINKIKEIYDVSFVKPESFYELKKYFLMDNITSSDVEKNYEKAR